MEIYKNQAIISIAVGFLLIVLIGSVFWEYMWEDEFLGKWASIFTIISLISVPIAYLLNQNKIKKVKSQKEFEERYRTSGNLYGELQDTLEALNRKQYPDDAFSFETKDGKEYFFMNRTLNHDFYDSLIFSGKINFLRPEVQQHVQNTFHQIKTHNEYVDLVLKMKDEVNIENYL